jgi:leucyl aminopeptidase
VRDLVAAPPNLLTPATFVDQVSDMAASLDLSVEIFDDVRLKDEGYGGLTAVGQGSINPPRMMVLRWSPPQPTHHIALVGKGITFDSGGLSLKPANSMVGMKYDMTGAAVVSAVALASAELKVGAAVTAWVCLAENMPSGSASRPNDVIRIKNGTTVEILNTDAEGRLVLADGLSAASVEEPDLLIDIATLTGAARVALGERYAGLMGTPQGVDTLQDAAEQAGELVWPMPLPEELRSLLTTDVADIANAKPGNTLGGMLLAGLFLQEFVGKTADGSRIPWAHLDIAGPAETSSGAWGYTPKGPTGALTRTLLSVVSAPRPKSK